MAGTVVFLTWDSALPYRLSVSSFSEFLQSLLGRETLLSGLFEVVCGWKALEFIAEGLKLNFHMRKRVIEEGGEVGRLWKAEKSVICLVDRAEFASFGIEVQPRVFLVVKKSGEIATYTHVQYEGWCEQRTISSYKPYSQQRSPLAPTKPLSTAISELQNQIEVIETATPPVEVHLFRTCEQRLFALFRLVTVSDFRRITVEITGAVSETYTIFLGDDLTLMPLGDFQRNSGVRINAIGANGKHAAKVVDLDMEAVSNMTNCEEPSELADFAANQTLFAVNFSSEDAMRKLRRDANGEGLSSVLQKQSLQG